MITSTTSGKLLGNFKTCAWIRHASASTYWWYIYIYISSIKYQIRSAAMTSILCEK